jgi:hypothetical protein
MGSTNSGAAKPEIKASGHGDPGRSGLYAECRPHGIEEGSKSRERNGH